MAHRSEVVPGNAQDVTEELKSKAAQALALAAVHLATVRPGDVLEEDVDLAVVVGAKVYDVGGRTSGSGSGISRLALEALGDIVPRGGITRLEAAAPMAQAAQVLGYDWSDDDDRRVIPSIPGPRRTSESGSVPAPRPAQGTEAGR
jgi:hypothetical protein